MGDERVAKRAVRVFEPRELEAIARAATILTDAGVDAADPKGKRAAERGIGGSVPCCGPVNAI
jgi:hypothetical protein